AAAGLGRAAATLLAPTAAARGVLPAARARRQAAEHTADAPAVTRPGALDPDTVAASLAIPAAARLPDHPRLTATLNRGELPRLGPRSSLGALCATLLRDLLPAETSPVCPTK